MCETNTGPNQPSRNVRLRAALAVGYVIIVLAVDTLSAHGAAWPFQWSALRWRTGGGFDCFKFVAWFVVPAAYSLVRMDWGYFGFSRWRRVDVLLLASGIVFGALALLIVPHVASLRGIYPGLGHSPSEVKWAFAKERLCWTASWLIGWEFMFRYALLTALQDRWPRRGWLLVPLLEVLYHLQKPWIETVGMGAFSLVATRWAVTRRNVLLPFFIHLSIELGLLALQLLV